MSVGTAPHILRLTLALSGALAGVATWAMVELIPDIVDNARIILALAAACGGFFTLLLATLGPLSLPRALLSAAAVGLTATVLLVVASLRFETVEPFLETLHPLAAFTLLVTLTVPFLIAGLGARGRWMDYPTLFDEAWNAFVRVAAALVFTGLFWLVLRLGDTLLKLVGLEIIEDLLDIDVVPFVLSGLVFGLALSVAHELSDYVSPALPIRLLRLLLPLVLVLTAIFLAALPLRGLTGLFGGLSPAATLMTMVLAGATLVTSVLDRDAVEAAEARVMRGAAQAMALLMPVMAGIALYAVIERVGQYGWSPDRLAALTVGAVLLGHGLVYGLAVLGRGDWAARIRRGNAALALLTIGLAALWLSPLLDAQKLSSSSQLSRYEAGRVSAADVDVWALGREWGRSGRDALDRMLALETDMQAVLQERVAAMETATSRYAFELTTPEVLIQPIRDSLLARMAVQPEGAELPRGFLERIDRFQLERWNDACDRETPAGAPGCVAVLGDFVPGAEGDVVVVFTLATTRSLRYDALRVSDGRVMGARWLGRAPHGTESADLLDQLRSGAFTLGPPSRDAIRLGEDEFLILD